MRIASVLVVVIVGVHSPAWAVCIGPGNSDCLPDDPLKVSFVEAVQKVPCHDVVRVDEEGRDLDPPGPWPLSSFARDHGEGAIPFYEAVIANCHEHRGWPREVFMALAYLGTPRAVEVLNRHAQPGQPNREAALGALPNVLSPQSLAKRLLQEPDPEVRRVFAISLWAHADTRDLPALRDALQHESDPQASQMLRAAVLQAEEPDKCVLVENSWGWATLGNVCSFVCRGIDLPIHRTAWRAILPCERTVSRGHHLGAPHATRVWLIPILLVVGADALLRRGLAQGYSESGREYGDVRLSARRRSTSASRGAP